METREIAMEMQGKTFFVRVIDVQFQKYSGSAFQFSGVLGIIKNTS